MYNDCTLPLPHPPQHSCPHHAPHPPSSHHQLSHFTFCHLISLMPHTAPPLSLTFPQSLSSSLPPSPTPLSCSSPSLYVEAGLIVTRCHCQRPSNTALVISESFCSRWWNLIKPIFYEGGAGSGSPLGLSSLSRVTSLFHALSRQSRLFVLLFLHFITFLFITYVSLYYYRTTNVYLMLIQL